MRKILFKGKRIDNGEWVEGYLVEKINPLLGMSHYFILTQEHYKDCITGKPTILKTEMSWYEVDPETVGLYTNEEQEAEQERECPTCYGTGKLHTSDWLVKGITKEQLAKEKEEVIQEGIDFFRKEAIKEFVKRFEDELSKFDLSSVGLPDYDRGYADCLTAIEDVLDGLAKEV